MTRPVLPTPADISQANLWGSMLIGWLKDNVSSAVVVTGYDATGDGETDDYAAIQACIDDNLGKTIYFPAGTYKISQTLVVAGDNTHLVGVGIASCIQTATDITAIQLGDATHSAWGSYIEKLWIKNGAAAEATSTTCGIKCYNDAYKSVIRDCLIGYLDGATGWFGHGVDFGGTGSFGSAIEDCLIRYNIVGIYKADNGARIVGNWLQGGYHGIVLGMLDANNMPDLTDTSTTEGVPGYGIVIEGNVIEDLTHPSGMAYGIFVKHTGDFPRIRANYFESIGREHDGQEDGVAVQVSYNDGAGHYLVKGGCISDCIFSDIGQAVKINGAWWGGQLSGNSGYYLNAGTYLIDASDHYASATSRLTIGEQYGFTGEVENPTTRIAVWIPNRATAYVSQTAKTADYTVTIADSGSLLTNGGATGAVICTLPAANTAGLCRWRFRKESDYPFYVTPYSGTGFQGLAVNEALELQHVGDEVVIESHQTTGTSYVVLSYSSRLVWRQHGESSHSYASGTTAWTMTITEASARLITVTSAGGAADAVIPLAMRGSGHSFIVYNNSGQAITFKVSGQTGSAVANGKRALFVIDSTDCREIYEQP